MKHMKWFFRRLGLTLLFALVLGVAALAQAPTLELLAQWGGTSYAVAVDGTTVYLGVGPRLLVLDAADPSAPVEIGRSAPMPNTVEDVVVRDGYAYVAAELYGLRVLSVADPANPVEVASLDTADCAAAVFLAGDLAYVADRYEGLVIVSIANPADPRLLAALDTPGNAQDVVVRNDYAYVADGSGGVCVISVVDPAQPTVVGACEAVAGVTNITLQGDYAYVCCGSNGWGVLSLADPADPQRVGALPLPYPSDTYLVGEWAFVSTNWDGLYVLGIADKTHPLIYTEVRYGGGSPSIAGFADFLYAASDEQGLIVFGLHNPEMPSLLGRYDPAAYGMRVAASGTLACLIDSADGLHIVSVDDATSPEAIGFFACSGLNGLTVDGPTVYLCGSDVLIVVDATDPAAPVEVGRVDLPDYAEAVAVDDAYAYVLCPYGGLQIVSIANPAEPTLVASLPIDGYAQDIVVIDDLAYVGVRGLDVVSIADPHAPERVGAYAGDALTYSLVVDDDRVYLSEDSVFSVLSLADPTAPAPLARRTMGLRSSIAIVDDIAVLGLEWQGVLLVDLSDLDWLPTVTSLDTADRACDIAVVGDRIYVADQNGGLYVLRIGSRE